MNPSCSFEEFSVNIKKQREKNSSNEFCFALSPGTAKRVLKELDEVFVPLFEYFEDTPISAYQKSEKLRHSEFEVNAGLFYQILLGLDSTGCFLQIFEIRFDRNRKNQTEEVFSVSCKSIKKFHQKLREAINEIDKCAQQYLLLDEQRFEIQISNYTDHEVDFKKRSQLYLAPIHLSSSLTTDGNTIIKMAQIDVDEIRMTVVKAKEFFKLLTTVFIPHYFKEIESIFSVDIEPVSTIRDENYFFELSFKSSQSSQESLHVLQKDVANNSEHVITILASEMEDISRKLKEIVYETESSQNNSSSHHSAPTDIKSREIHNSTKPPYCGECKQIGHVFRHCPLTVCKKCRKTGHIRIDCHDYNGQREKEEYNDDEPIYQFTSANSASSFGRPPVIYDNTILPEVADYSKGQTHVSRLIKGGEEPLRFEKVASIAQCIGKHDDYFNLNIETAENLCYAIETIFIPAYSYASESNNKIPDDLSNICRRVGDTREYNFSLLEEQGRYYLWLTEHHNLNKHEQVQRSIDIPANFMSILLNELKRKVKQAHNIQSTENRMIKSAFNLAERKTELEARAQVVSISKKMTMSESISFMRIDKTQQ